MMTEFDRLFDEICGLVACHSPSGVEEEVDEYLRRRFSEIGMECRSDASGNLVARVAGRGGGRIAITAHKDEIGAIVNAIGDDGRLRVQKLGGSFPWVYGEGVVDLVGTDKPISGILSFGSRHVSHISPQHAHHETKPLKWEDAWIETKQSTEALNAAGVRIGTRVVIGRHRKAPFRLSNDHIASYTLDNKASLAILLQLARRLRDPFPDVYLIATAKEEIGALGALFFTHAEPMDAILALEVAPTAPE